MTTRRLAVAFAVAMLGLSACGGGGDDKPNATGGADTNETTKLPAKPKRTLADSPDLCTLYTAAEMRALVGIAVEKSSPTLPNESTRDGLSSPRSCQWTSVKSADGASSSVLYGVSGVVDRAAAAKSLDRALGRDLAGIGEHARWSGDSSIVYVGLIAGDVAINVVCQVPQPQTTQSTPAPFSGNPPPRPGAPTIATTTTAMADAPGYDLLKSCAEPLARELVRRFT